MNSTVLARPFAKMGARVQLGELDRRSRLPFTLDVRRDGDGEYFSIRTQPDTQLQVLHVAPRDRHLVLLARVPDARRPNRFTPARYLCGHDERHWFVAGLPERARVTTVTQAKEALKPAAVQEAERDLRARQ